MSAIRHKMFISFHHDDQKEIEKFIEEFDEKKDIFISRALGMSSDIIDSNDTDYVMRRIRELYLKDTTVTLVMIGKCTWARRYIDWEIQASLRHGEKTIPNGLMGIRLPSYNKNRYPNRLNLNLKQSDDQKECYARVHRYPKNKDELRDWIEDAFQARSTRVKYIVNPRERFVYNRTCP